MPAPFTPVTARPARFEEAVGLAPLDVIDRDVETPPSPPEVAADDVAVSVTDVGLEDSDEDAVDDADVGEDVSEEDADVGEDDSDDDAEDDSDDDAEDDSEDDAEDDAEDDSEVQVAVGKKLPRRMPPALASTCTKQRPGAEASSGTLTLPADPGPTWKSVLD